MTSVCTFGAMLSPVLSQACFGDRIWFVLGDLEALLIFLPGALSIDRVRILRGFSTHWSTSVSDMRLNVTVPSEPHTHRSLCESYWGVGYSSSSMTAKLIQMIHRFSPPWLLGQCPCSSSLGEADTFLFSQWSVPLLGRLCFSKDAPIWHWSFSLSL